MRVPKDLKPIEWRQLCAVARELLTADPTISDAEWKARIKKRLARLEFDYPTADTIVRAMGSVERALAQTLGPRPTPVPVSPVTPPQTLQQPHEPPWKRLAATSGKWASMSELIASLQGCVSSAPSCSALPEASGHEIPGISEPIALGLFWNHAENPASDRLALLQRFAEIAIVRPADWDAEAVRAQFERLQFGAAARCFACRSGDRTIVRHHVVQLQHGGSNTPRNFVAICTRCHAAIHPWVADSTTQHGWTSIADFARGLMGSRDRGAPMKTWRIANRRIWCGYDPTHTIAAGESYLEIEERGRKRVRCAKCAPRHETPVAVEAHAEEAEPAPVVAQEAVPDPEPEFEGDPW